MYAKKMQMVGAAYLLALIVANLTDSTTTIRILAVIAGVIGVFHIAYDAIWTVDTTWRDVGQSRTEFILSLLKNGVWDIMGLIVVIGLTTFTLIHMNILTHLVCVAAIATISYGAIRSADNTARRAQAGPSGEKSP